MQLYCTSWPLENSRGDRLWEWHTDFLPRIASTPLRGLWRSCSMQWDNDTHCKFLFTGNKRMKEEFFERKHKKKLQLLTDGTVQRNQFVVSPGAQLYVYSQLVHRNYPAIPTSFSPFHSWFWGHINVFLKQTSNREWITA